MFMPCSLYAYFFSACIKSVWCMYPCTLEPPSNGCRDVIEKIREYKKIERMKLRKCYTHMNTLASSFDLYIFAESILLIRFLLSAYLIIQSVNERAPSMACKCTAAQAHVCVCIVYYTYNFTLKEIFDIIGA